MREIDEINVRGCEIEEKLNNEKKGVDGVMRKIAGRI